MIRIHDIIVTDVSSFLKRSTLSLMRLFDKRRIFHVVRILWLIWLIMFDRRWIALILDVLIRFDREQFRLWYSLQDRIWTWWRRVKLNNSRINRVSSLTVDSQNSLLDSWNYCSLSLTLRSCVRILSFVILLNTASSWFFHTFCFASLEFFQSRMIFLLMYSRSFSRDLNW
jgi:hypothetical protein